ncbi:MAG: carbohydrate-binding family 9-like protein [Cyclobacteriaceae bacterium]|nr:carbohydrate-binding family 9-like protein [Cyclobacteriaceae bacterium]
MISVKINHRIVLLIALTLCASNFSSRAQDATEKSDVTVIHRTTDFELSGDGKSENWNNTKWLQLTKRKGLVNYNTQAKLLYSDQGIYALVACEDKKITATLTKDFADLYTEDVVEIFFWTDESTPLYFEYELSPLNYELAILVPNFKGDFFGWTPWHYEGDRKTRHATKVIKDEKGSTTSWIAEIFIPYALLKPMENVPPKPGTQWRINLYRIDYDDGSSSWTWKPVETNFHDFERFGTFQFE